MRRRARGFGLAAFAVGVTLCAPALAAALDPTVAVLYFDYDGKDEELGVLRKGLAQMLISDLAGGNGYTVVERARLQDLIDEMQLGQSKKFDRKTAAKIGKLLGARYLVLGSYFSLFGTLKIDACVVNVETGANVRCVGAGGKPEDFIHMQQELSGGLAPILAAELPATEASAAAKPKVTPNSKPKGRRPAPPKKLGLATAVRYAKALDAADHGRSVEAKEQLQAVVKEAPDFTLAALDLANLVQ